MNLNSVIIPSAETFPSIVNNEVSVVLATSKTFKFEKRSQYKSQSFDHVRFSCENITIVGKYEDYRLQSKERINVLFVMT